MLEVVNIDTYYGTSQVLRGVSLKVKEGQVVALLGRNGMGKTTTVRSIMGLTPARSGTIRFDGKDITRLESYKIARMGLGLVPQGRHIFPSLSVKENLVIAMRGKGFNLDSIYSYFPILEKRGNHRGNQISGGEQQMLAIARTLLTNPKLILMDEPSEGLAPIVIQAIGNIIPKIKEQGLSILLVEQNVSLALGTSDYCYVMHKGEVVYSGNTDDLAKNEKIQSEYIGVSRGQ